MVANVGQLGHGSGREQGNVTNPSLSLLPCSLSLTSMLLDYLLFLNNTLPDQCIVGIKVQELENHG